MGEPTIKRQKRKTVGSGGSKVKEGVEVHLTGRTYPTQMLGNWRTVVHGKQLICRMSGEQKKKAQTANDKSLAIIKDLWGRGRATNEQKRAPFSIREKRGGRGRLNFNEKVDLGKPSVGVGRINFKAHSWEAAVETHLYQKQKNKKREGILGRPNSRLLGGKYLRKKSKRIDGKIEKKKFLGGTAL